jgi:hypothetical protein
MNVLINVWIFEATDLTRRGCEVSSPARYHIEYDLECDLQYDPEVTLSLFKTAMLIG